VEGEVVVEEVEEIFLGGGEGRRLEEEVGGVKEVRCLCDERSELQKRLG